MDNSINNDPHKTHLKFANALFENSEEALIFTNSQGVILDANPTCFKLLETPIESLLNNSILHLLSINNPNIETIKNKTTYSYINGSKTPKKIKLSFIQKLDLNVFLVKLKEVSTLEENELLLHKYKEQINAINENEKDCIKILDRHCKLIDINQSGLDIIGAHKKSDVLGASVIELVTNKYQSQFLSLVDNVFQGNKDSLIFEIKSLNGTYHWLDTTASPLYEKDGKTIKAILSVTKIITDKKKTEESLLESQQTFNNIFEMSPVPLLISRISDGEIIMANQGIEKMVQKTKKDLIGDNTINYYADESERIEIIREMSISGEINGKELKIKDSHGNIKAMLIYVQFLMVNNEKVLLSSFIDITERKEKDILIENSKNELESIVNILPDLLFRFDKENRFIFYHTNNKEQLLVSPDIFTGKKVDEVMPSPLGDMLIEKLNLTRSTKSLQLFEYELPKNNFESSWFESRMLCLKDDEVLAIIRDITAQKKGEIAIKESEYKFRSLIQNLTVGVFVVETNGNIVLSNTSALQLLGLTEDELTGKTPFHSQWSAIHEDGTSFPISEHPVQQAIKTSKAFKNVRMGIQSPRLNDIVWLSVDAIPHIDNEGNMTIVVCTLYDITINKKAEEALQKSEDNLRTVFQNTEVGYILFNNGSRILSFNDNANEYNQKEHNLTLKEGLFFLDVIHDEQKDRISKILQNILTGQSIEYDISFEKNQISSWYHIKYSPVYNHIKQVSGFLMSIEDVTQRKNDELDLINSFNLVTEQNERLLNFSYIVSHNLRSHTSNIKMVLNLLDLEHDEQERNELLNNLKAVSDSLNETIQNLNNVVSIQTNINTTTEPLNLREYSEQAILVLNKQITDKKITLNNNIPKNTIIQYNPAYLESILLNFISNAIKYSDQEKNPIIEINSYIEDKKRVIEFKDNGIGIDLKKYGDKLFGMYKTFHGNSDARGLGLFISKNQIENLGGYIDVKSEVKKGTVFKIFIK